MLNFRKILVRAAEFDYKKHVIEEFRRSQIDGLLVKEKLATTFSEDRPVNRSETPPSEVESDENWWDYCPICNSKLLNQKCKYICPNSKCNFFMSCSEFDL